MQVIKTQNDVPCKGLHAKYEKIWVGNKRNVSVVVFLLKLMIYFYETWPDIIWDYLSDAEVVTGDIGDFGVVVDGEEVGWSVEALHSSKVIRHEYVTIIITFLSEKVN